MGRVFPTLLRTILSYDLRNKLYAADLGGMAMPYAPFKKMFLQASCQSYQKGASAYL